MKRTLLHTFAAVLSATPASAQFTVTAPAGGQVSVKAADDFATRAFQDPWDMSQRTDVGWWLFGNDFPPSNWTNPTFSNGLFSGTTTGTSAARLFLLESGLAATPGGSAVPIGKTGQQFPIDANKYTHLLYRMSSPTGFQDTGDPNNLSQFIWSTNTIYEDQTLAVNKEVIKGMAIYDVDLTALTTVPSLGTKSAWTGTKRSFQFLPNNRTGILIELDWARLVDGSDPTLFQTITWTGSGAADLYLDNNNIASDGNLGRIAINNSTRSFRFFIGGLEPGTYYVAIGTHANDPVTNGSGLVYSTGFYQVNAIPTLTFTTPSDEGSTEDFATVRLGNPWDFTSMSDIDFKGNINSDSITQLALTSEAGVSLGNQTVYLGTSDPGTPASGNVGDPSIVPLFWDLRGKVTQIDPARYRILTVEAGIPNMARSLLNGSIGRVGWRALNESTRGSDGLPGQTIAEHYEFNHKTGENTLSRSVIDMKDMPIEPGSTGQSSWLSTTSLGGLDAFRFDPHEFASPTQFFVKRIKLAALERTVADELTFRWTYSKSSGTVSLFRQASGTAKTFSGGTTIVPSTSATAGSYVWNTTGVPDGEYQIYAIFTDGTNSNQVYAPTPIVIDHSNVAVKTIILSRTQLNFATFGAVRTDPQIVRLTFSGTGSECWTSSSNLAGLVISPSSGTGATAISISLAAGANFPGGTTNALITIQSCSNPSNARAIAVSVTSLNTTTAPIGAIDTPADGSVVAGSVAVTGWAADDVQVASVRICRDPATGEATTPSFCGGQSRVFIGDAIFIDDARSDIESANPTKPFNYRAGWGYLMLTNFLPNQGNGPVTLYAFATDREGNVALLGSKSISTQNATATKPFGAIDTPGQGAAVCGTVINFGWALTQPGKDVPADSSTIAVFIDDVFVGRPGARAARSDITAAFPQYNTTHAVGGFVFDTTQYANGVHTIFWVVSDNTGQQDGIGSRFFTVANPCGS